MSNETSDQYFEALEEAQDARQAIHDAIDDHVRIVLWDEDISAIVSSKEDIYTAIEAYIPKRKCLIAVSWGTWDDIVGVLVENKTDKNI